MTTDFIEPTIDWAHLAPIIAVLGAGVLGVLVEAFVPARSRRVVQLVVTALGIAAALTAVVVLWPGVQESGGVRIVGGTVLVDPFALAVQAILLVLGIFSLLLFADRSSGDDAFAPAAAAVPGSAYEDLARAQGVRQTEAFPLLLCSLGGMMIFASTSNLLMMFVALEVLSLPLYVLSALARRRRLLSQEAGFKYFLLGAFASAIFLFGVALMYGATASVDLAEIRMSIARGDETAVGGLLMVGLIMVIVGILFKVGAAPFHVWVPDVYKGAPTPVSAFMAACTKAAAFGALVRIVVVVAPTLGIQSAALAQGFEVALWIVAILSMLVGTLVAIPQTDMKRMLGYSAIAHTGFILIGVVGLFLSADIRGFSGLGVRSTLFYLLAYGVATLGAFAAITLVRETTAAPVLATTAGAGVDGGTAELGGEERQEDVRESTPILGEATHMAQWAGLGRRSPWLAAAYSLFLLSLAGIPLTGGFIAKYTSFQAGIASGATWLAVIGVLTSVVAVFFYVRIIVLFYFTTPDEESTDHAPVKVLGMGGPAGVTVVVCAVAVIFLGVFPSPVLDLVAQAAKFVP
ncbi:NADH dehydrogenase subunit N [Paraoerskovia marina]|uniref:NADH-quinone oxidoreductase subunit N n=1 Tax=Paraoerskovia marina TaxID=545619 RepID=A0A1H1VHS3_9CELL|nr:NADH-quinone oxidoreductase subunit NuoN [Paraoerskovia marina]SDS83911.1 NADH dehydrogenase subunit N [Paraoerskovia marina]